MVGRRKKAQKILQLGLNYVPNDETLASALKKLQSGNDKIMPATQSHSILSSMCFCQFVISHNIKLVFLLFSITMLLLDFLAY